MRIAMIWIALCLAACAAVESDIVRLGPKPPVERFPATRYVAPPTPEERVAAQAAEKAAALAAEAMRAARAQQRLAVSNLLVAVGVDAGSTMDPAVIGERAKVLSTVAAAVGKDAAVKEALSSALKAAGTVGVK